MRSERFFKDPNLPFAELRCSRSSSDSFKPHMHRTLGIGAVDDGEVIYTLIGETASLVPGTLVVFNPEALHACNPAEGSVRSYYMLHLDTDWCLKVQQTLWNVGGFIAAEKTRIENAALYEAYCRTMVLLMDGQVHLEEKEQALYELICDIFTVVCRPGESRETTGGDVARLKKLLSTDLQRDWPLDSLAASLDANPYTLIRSFKAVTGITPHAYRMNCRIEKARELLREGREIADTALECGFFDQSHFHRYFKAMTTVTPQAYRINFLQ